MKKLIFVIHLLMLSCAVAVAQGQPSVSPTAVYTLSDGSTMSEATEPLSAPVVGTFSACPQDVGDYEARYEWKIFHNSPNSVPIIHRFDEDIEHTFTKSGNYYIQLQVTFVQGNDTIVWPEEGEAQPLTVTIAESKLEFPNAFSPNGDGINDVFRAKDGYQSIVSFEATVFSRQGVRLYSWTNLDGGWDGRYNGHTVRDGVYFLVVKARGADGINYNLRRDINVLTGTRDNNNGATE